MKFAAVLAFVAAAAVVSAETNAERFARGLPPLPVKRASPVEAARRHYPSKVPGGKPPGGKPPGKTPGGECDTGSIQCCNSVGKCGDGGDIDNLLGLVGATAAIGSVVGVGCSSVVGASDCSQKPVCCDNNEYSGIVVVGCSPIDVA